MIRLEAYVTFEERFCFKLFLCEVKSPESVQVKLSAIEIKVQFTQLLENFEQDFRLLMNDLSNLLERKNVWRGTIQITSEAENFVMNH